MMRFQISIARLMSVVALCALGLASVRYASPGFSDFVAAVTALTLLTATIGAFKGRSRTAWLGFATFGWGFALLAWGFAMHEAVSNVPARSRTIPPMTISIPPMAIPITPLTAYLDELYPVVHHAPPRGMVNGTVVKAWPAGGIYASFQWIGHSLACLLFGLIGSAVAVFMDRVSRRPESTGGSVAGSPEIQSGSVIHTTCLSSGPPHTPL